MDSYDDQFLAGDQYETPWLTQTPAAGSSNPLIGGLPTDTAPVSSPGGGGINEAAPATAGSPWLPDAPSGTTAVASAPGTTPAAAAAPAASSAAQSEIDKHTMAQSLEADGHDVSWNPQGQMVVDGRVYDVAGNDQGQPTIQGTGPTANGAPNTPAPGNDDNQIQGWGQQFLGHGFTEDQLQQYFRGQPLDVVMHDIANSPEALAYANAHGFGAPNPGAAGPGDAGPTGSQFGPLDMSVPQWLKDMVPGYTPTMLDTSLSELPDFQTLFQSASGNNPNEAALDALVGHVLEHPESLTEQDIQTLKGKAAEEAAVAAQANDEDLLHFGANSNLTDSPWLASARQANAQARRNTTIQSNQNLDIAAADRRAADQRSAASLGITASNAKTARAQAATATAMSGVLAKVNAQTTRAQLNESFKQAATELGLSTAGLATNYVLGNAGIQIDENKLAQQSDQWKQDLALKIAQLKQQSDQFDADLQLELQKFQHSKDNDAWAQAQAAYAA